MTKNRSKPQLGDVYEVPTRRGLTYIQYVFQNKLIGEFVRILPNFFTTTPPLTELVDEPSRLLVSYPLAAAARAGLVRHVGNLPIPEAHCTFPLMRAGGNWLWDGEREWREPAFGAEHRKLPHRASVMHGLLVHYIEHELTNEQIDDRGVPTVLFEEDESATARDDVGHDDATGGHYLYFAKKRKAERARGVVERHGLRSEVRPSADGENWLLLVEVGDDLEEERDLLERIAEGNDGEYDGWEARL